MKSYSTIFGWQRLLVLMAIAGLGFFSARAQTKQPRVLVFSKTTRYQHASIPAGILAIQKLGAQNGFQMDTTTDAHQFSDQHLQQYAAVIFLSTSGNLLDSLEKNAFMRYIRAGGGYMGIHSASASEKDWTWYGQLVGAVFTDHPEPQTGVIKVTDRKDPATQHLPPRWKWKDEWYNFAKVPTGVHVLFCADESTYQGGKNGAYHPLAWYHAFDGGRAFYTGLGHYDEAYTNPLFETHLLAGIHYAMGQTHTSRTKELKSKRIK